MSRFPFTPTKSQINTIDTILDDFIKKNQCLDWSKET